MTWDSRAGGKEHILTRPDRIRFRVYLDEVKGGWLLSSHGMTLLPEHRGKVWETAREAAMAAKEYAQTERGEP